MQSRTATAPSREDAIDELLGLLQRTSTAGICGYVSALWMKQGKEVADDTGLSSPQRETSYLLGLAMTTREPEIEEPLPKASWERILTLLNAITDSYVHDNMKAVTVDGVDPQKAHAASMAFIQRFMSGRLAVADQLERLVRGMHRPFDDRLSAALGITATEALEIVAWMADILIELRRHVFETGARAKAIQVETVEMLFSGPESYDEKLKTWRASKDYRKAEEVFRSYFFGTRYFNCIPLTRFVDRFGQERTDAFLNAFALRRGSVTRFRYFASPNPPNPAELAPSFLVKDHKGNELLSVPLHAMFYNALYDRFDDVLRADSAVKDRYLKKRSGYLEERANGLVASLFPDASVILGRYFETSRRGNEHDGLILAGRSLLILEEKSAEMKTPSRDIERCFRNLTDQFKSNRGIQHAYNQANRVVSIIEDAAGPVPFYGEHGQVVAEIDPAALDETLSICVTLESFGVLAVDLTLLLDTSAGKPYPLAVNLFDLEALVEAFHHKGLSGNDFLRYLRLRRESQGRLLSDDELNLAGKFIFDGTLPKVPPDTFLFVASGAEVFDDLFFEKHGVKSNLTAGWVPGGVQMDLRESLKIGKPVFVPPDGPHVSAGKPGRNEACPCGSNKKYKKCCGRLA
jgi:hypothetical protein